MHIICHLANLMKCIFLPADHSPMAAGGIPRAARVRELQAAARRAGRRHDRDPPDEVPGAEVTNDPPERCS